MNPYSFKKVGLPAVLTDMHSKMLKSRINQIDSSTEIFEAELYDLCSQAASEMSGGEEKKTEEVRKRLIGELVSANSELLLDTNDLDEETKKLLENYKNQKELAPNHPYRFKKDSEEIVEFLALDAFQKAGKDIDVGHSLINPFVFSIIIIMLATLIFLLVPYMDNWYLFLGNLKDFISLKLLINL